jgi:DNA-binding HxlR family transcriptional regulator
VRRTRFDDAPCPIARTTDLIGDWWTPIVLREAFFGSRRFEQFQERLGVPRATLTERLARLVDEGLLTRTPYQEHPVRYEYRLTDKGRAFFDVLAAMWRFGEDWLFEPDDPIRIELADRTSGVRVEPRMIDATTGRPLDIRALTVRRRRGSPTPSAPAAGGRI